MFCLFSIIAWFYISSSQLVQLNRLGTGTQSTENASVAHFWALVHQLRTTALCDEELVDSLSQKLAFNQAKSMFGSTNTTNLVFYMSNCFYCLCENYGTVHFLI